MKKPSYGISRQRRWQKQQVALDRCAICGSNRPAGLKNLCRQCQNKATEYDMAVYYKNKARMDESADILLSI